MAGAETAVAVFGGLMTDNVWEDVVIEPNDLRLRDSQAIGVSVAREWPLGAAGFWGVELAALHHFGEETRQEVSVPVYLRSVRPQAVLVPSVAYGLGLTYSTRTPEVEIDRRGESQPLLAH